MSRRITQLRALFDGLAPRERLLLLASAALATLLLAWLAILNPVLAAMDRAEARVEIAERNLQTARRLRRELDTILTPLSQVESRIQRERRGNLFTTLESLARQSAIQVESMEPEAASSEGPYQETKVEVVLKNVTLAQVVNYLHRIESAPQLLSIKTVRMRTLPTQGDLLDVTFTVSSFETQSR